jgi:hypothetical protein
MLCNNLVMMTVWLNAENDAELEGFQFQVVSNRDEASRIREGNAREVLKAALRDFPEFEWITVPVSGDRFLIQGTSRG